MQPVVARLSVSSVAWGPRISQIAASIALPRSVVLAVPPISRGQIVTVLEHVLYRGHDGVVRVLVPEVLQHHRPGPDRADRVCDALTGDIRGGAVDGLEHRRMIFLRIHIRGWCDCDRARARGAEVGENVAEEIASDNDVEVLGYTNEVRGKYIDVKVFDGDAGIMFGHFINSAVPVRHGMNDAVRFCPGRHTLRVPRLSQLECVLQDPVDSVASKNILLDDELALRTFILHAADCGVLTFDVLAYDIKIDVAGRFPGKRAGHAVEQPYRAKIDVLIEFTAYRDQQAP